MWSCGAPEQRLRLFGGGLVRFGEVTLAKDIKVYFMVLETLGSVELTRVPTGCCDSTSQKGIDLSLSSQDQLDEVAKQLNERPQRLSPTQRLLSVITILLRRPVESTADSDPSNW